MARLVVKGPGLAQELVYANTLGARAFDNALPAAAVDELLALPVSQGVTTLPWTRGTFTPTTRFSDRDDWIPALQGLFKIAEALNVHTRFHPYLRKADMSAFGVDSGLVLVNPRETGPLAFSTGGANVGYIDRIQIIEESTDQCTIVVPLGQGEGNNAWTIKYSTRTTPYTVQSATGPDGLPYYYLRDAAAAAAIGRDIIKPVLFKDVGPLANSALAWELASNALHDLGTTYLSRHSGEQATYSIEASKLDSASFSVGDVIRVLFDGYVEDSTGVRRLWKHLDSQAIVLEKRREYASSGLPKWGLVLSTVGRWRETAEEIIVGTIETLQAFKTAVKPYTFISKSGPIRESISFTGSNWCELDVEIDANVRGLLASTLRVSGRALKSNVKDAPAKLGQTASGGSHGHAISAGASTAGGTSHTHTLNNPFTEGPRGASGINDIRTGASIPDATSTQVLEPDGSHVHDMARHYHRLDGSVASPYNALPAHFHNISTTISLTGETTHTHDISGKTTTAVTHTHDLGAHSHDLTYGIFETSKPSAPGYAVFIDSVDRTVALGGPWNADFTADVSPYMTDSEGRPKWGTRRFEIRKALTAPVDAMDVIVEVESMEIATALMPA